MKIEKGLLSKRIQDKYNYVLTKNEVNKFIDDISLLEFRIKTMKFPSITSSYELRENQFIARTTSKEEEFVVLKISMEEELKEKKAILDDIIASSFINIEKLVFTYSLEDGMSDERIAEKEDIDVYVEYVRLVKKSLILKIGIGLGVAVLKESQQ